MHDVEMSTNSQPRRGTHFSRAGTDCWGAPAGMAWHDMLGCTRLAVWRSFNKITFKTFIIYLRSQAVQCHMTGLHLKFQNYSIWNSQTHSTLRLRDKLLNVISKLEHLKFSYTQPPNHPPFKLATKKRKFMISLSDCNRKSAVKFSTFSSGS